MIKKSTNHFCWQELATNNSDQAKAFYGELLGWKFTEKVAKGPHYTIISNAMGEFGGIWNISNDECQEISPHWMGYIAVCDLYQTVEKAILLGATVKTPITACGEHGAFAILIDPTGAPIAFWEKKAPC